MYLKSPVLRFAKASGLFALANKIMRSPLRILCYHGIWLGPRHFGNYLFMSADRFTQHIRFIHSNNYRILELNDALDRLDAGTLPDNAVVITIDDGWYSTYKYMVPILESYKIPATVYAYTRPIESESPVFPILIRYLLENSNPMVLRFDQIFENHHEQYDISNPILCEKAIASLARNFLLLDEGNKWRKPLLRLAGILEADIDHLLNERVFDLMNEDELLDCVSRGIDIELHTHNHVFDIRDPGSLNSEIVENQRFLNDISENSYEHFCYPSGYYHEDCFSELEQLGIKSATTTTPGFVYSSTNRLTLPRILDGENISDLEFEAELCGFMEIRRLLSLRSFHLLKQSK